MKKLFNVIVFFVLLINTSKANSIAIKCYIDEEQSYSFLLNKNDKTVSWLDQDNQKMAVTIFPDVDKGGKLLIMGGIGKNNEKHTFIIDVVKALMSVTTNLGFNKTGKCGNKSIIEPKDQYAD
tara:strand:- start:246 stop:614 length:369 start_codon:yes stop_codon:yes gene_type:complete